MNNGALSVEEYYQEVGQYILSKTAVGQLYAEGSDFKTINEAAAEGFARRFSFVQSNQYSLNTYERFEIGYASLPGLKWGRKINVSKLGAEQPASVSTLFYVSPNPADQIIIVRTGLPPQSLQFVLRDISGRVIKCTMETGQRFSIECATIPSGIYLLDVTGANVNQHLKVYVQH